MTKRSGEDFEKEVKKHQTTAVFGVSSFAASSAEKNIRAVKVPAPKKIIPLFILMGKYHTSSSENICELRNRITNEISTMKAEISSLEKYSEEISEQWKMSKKMIELESAKVSKLETILGVICPEKYDVHDNVDHKSL